MPPRRCWLVGCLIYLGCHTITAVSPDNAPAPEPAANKANAAAPAESAADLWEQGQAAMRVGDPRRAVAFYQRSLEADPSFNRNHLSLAAAYLEMGNDMVACNHLGRYVADHPEHLLVRSQHVELLLRLKRSREAVAAMALLIADAQEKGDDVLLDLIQYHSRLVEVAEEQEDDYAAHLNRGIGLYLLARQRASCDDPGGALPVEGLLCKAAGELTLARTLRPGSARASWYLHRVWSRLARPDSARRYLTEAADAAPFGDLTASEQRGLVLAWRARDTAARP
jgi:tetratricopeptide (TPR) repeat protein